MNTHEGTDFINQIYAGVSKGAICATLLPSKQNIWFDISEKENIYEALQKHLSENAYLSLCVAELPMSAYKRIARKNAFKQTAVVIDIDVFNKNAHTETNLPATKDEALELIKSLPLPEASAIIDTGNGFQVFWFFDEPYELIDEAAKKRAEHLSFGFNEIAIEEGRKRGYKFDNVGDLARIYRAPDTMNVKGGDPKPTSVIELTGERYGFDELLEYLPKQTAPKNTTFKCFKEDVEFEGKADLESVYRACTFIRRWIDEADSLPEPEWYAGLSIVARTLNGIEQAHKISSAYPKYNVEETERKIRQALSASGPVTCKQINKLGFDGCLSCPLFYSKNLNSPITIGFYEPSLAELLGRYAYSIKTAQFAEVRS